MPKIVDQKRRHIALGVFGLDIAVDDWRYDVMNPAHLKGIHDGAVNALKQSLSVFSPVDIVMVADHILHRNAHVFTVHTSQMGLQPVDVTDISRVYDKGRMCFFRHPAQLFNPLPRALCTYFAVRHLQKDMIGVIVFQPVKGKVITRFFV